MHRNKTNASLWNRQERHEIMSHFSHSLRQYVSHIMLYANFARLKKNKEIDADKMGEARRNQPAFVASSLFYRERQTPV